MSVGIATIATLVAMVFNIVIFSKINKRQTLGKFQTNIVVNYLNMSRKFGVAFYKWAGVAVFVVLGLMALNIDAWLSVVIFMAHIFFANRLHARLNNTGFVATDAAGNPMPSGGHLTPVTMDSLKVPPMPAAPTI